MCITRSEGEALSGLPYHQVPLNNAWSRSFTRRDHDARLGAVVVRFRMPVVIYPAACSISNVIWRSTTISDWQD